MEELSTTIWAERIWLPENVTWRQVEKEGNYLNAYPLLYCFPAAFGVIFIRLIIERIFFVPFGRLCGLYKTKIEQNDILENAFIQEKTSETFIKQLALSLNWDESKIQNWFHQRQKIQKISVKFNESGWRATFYSIMVLYGFNCLWDKPWFQDVSKSWTDRATFVPPNDVWWYYIIELAFYVSLMISQFVDVKRKDFWQMFVHHVVTIILIAGSWIVNSARIGSLIMLCHDVGDIPLEIAKLFGYLKMKQCCDVTFVVFLVTWCISRLIIYPFVILKSVFLDAHLLLGPAPRYFLTFLLLVLMCLHIIWTWLIVQILKSFISGTPKDVRSDSEDNVNSDTEEKKKK